MGLTVLSLMYIGPGAGIAVIGTVLAFIGALFLGIGGFVWYPIKRILRKKRNQKPQDDGQGRGEE